MKLRSTITASFLLLAYGSASVAEFTGESKDDPVYEEQDYTLKEIDEGYGSMDDYTRYTGGYRYSKANVGDLVVWFTNGSPSCTGGNLAVDYRVQNMLNDPVQETFKVLVTVGGQIHPDSAQNPSTVTGPLYGGKHIHLANMSPGPGLYRIEIEADYEHVAWEADETNNTASTWVECLE